MRFLLKSVVPAAILASFVSVVATCSAAATFADGGDLRVHIISGSKEYKSEESLKDFAESLRAGYRVNVTGSWVSDGAKGLPDADKIPAADVLIIFARRLKLPAEQVALVKRHANAGKPIVGIRTSSHAFSNDDNVWLDRTVMGGNYQGHFGGDAVTVNKTDAGKQHPVLQDVGEIVSEKLYKAGALADDVTLLQTGSIKAGSVTYPVTWTHTYKTGRMFYTSLGVPRDFKNPHFRQMLVNAVFWTAAKNMKDYQREKPGS